MKSLRIVAWVLFIVVGLLYVLIGLGKFSASAGQSFVAWQLPAVLAPIIGCVEILGGIALIIPRTTRYGVIILSVVMIGAALTHIFNAEYMSLLRPAIFAGLFWTAWWARRNSSIISTQTAP